MNNKKLLKSNKPYDLLKQAETFCKNNKMVLPKIYINSQKSPQLILWGLNQSRSLIFTQGFIDKFYKTPYLKTALHYGIVFMNSSMPLRCFSLTFFIFFFTHLTGFIDHLYQRIFAISKGDNPFCFSKSPFSYLGVLFIRPFFLLFIRKSLFFKLDKKVSKLTGSPTDLVELFEKMSRLIYTTKHSYHFALINSYFINPLTNYGYCRYLKAQPDIKMRVRKLKKI